MAVLVAMLWCVELYVLHSQCLGYSGYHRPTVNVAAVVKKAPDGQRRLEGTKRRRGRRGATKPCGCDCCYVNVNVVSS